MKMLRYILLACLFAVSLEETVLASNPEVYDLTIDGVRVIVQPVKENQVIAVQIGFRGGFEKGETDNPAIPSFAANVSTVSGTSSYPKDAYRAALMRLVTTISGSADYYGSKYSLIAVRPKFDESWKIFEDVIRRPLYDPNELAKLQDQELSNIASRRQEPETWVNFQLDSIWSAGHKVGRIVEANDVQAITIDNLRKFRESQIERSRMLIVIVGNVSREEVQKKVHELLNGAPGIPMGQYTSIPFERVQGPGKIGLSTEERALPTTYIVGRCNGPAREEPAFWPFRLMTLVLGDRLYEQVRTKRNLSYSPYASIGGGAGIYYTQIGVSSILPDSAMHVINHEIDIMRESGVTPKELRDTKESFITQVFMSQQSNFAEANRLYQAQLETGDYRTAFQMVDKMMNVSTDDTRSVADSYLRTFYWTAIGDENQIVKRDFLER